MSWVLLVSLHIQSVSPNLCRSCCSKWQAWQVIQCVWHNLSYLQVAESLWQSFNSSRCYLPLMQPEGSLPCSQEPTTVPAILSLHPHTVSLQLLCSHTCLVFPEPTVPATLSLHPHTVSIQLLCSHTCLVFPSGFFLTTVLCLAPLSCVLPVPPISWSFKIFLR
jgi:hypothetical protein